MMNKKGIVSNIIFWLTLFSPIVSFGVASEIGESDIFGVAGIVRYAWIMLLFVPIGVGSLIIGIKLKNNGQKYKKNIVVALICIPILIIFGSYTFLFNNISYNPNKIFVIQQETRISLPDQIKITSTPVDSYNLSYAKITSGESKNLFENEISSNQLWENHLSPNIRNLLPFNIKYEVETFDYFVFYNKTLNEYNICPLSGEHECIFIAYDIELCRFIIIDEYLINLNQ